MRSALLQIGWNQWNCNYLFLFWDSVCKWWSVSSFSRRSAHRRSAAQLLNYHYLSQPSQRLKVSAMISAKTDFFGIISNQFSIECLLWTECDWLEIIWKIKMATSLLAAKSFPGIRVCKPGDPKTPKKSINFGLTRKSPRCAQCLKFQTDDPS